MVLTTLVFFYSILMKNKKLFYLRNPSCYGSYIVDNLYVIVSKNIAHYRELRVKFEKCQEKHDKYLALYVSTPKTKDPLSTIEDAKQVYAVRRSYIHASLDLVIELSPLGSLLDRTLVRLSSELWTRKRLVLLGVPFSTDESFFKETYTRVQKIQSVWVNTLPDSVVCIYGHPVEAAKWSKKKE